MTAARWVFAEVFSPRMEAGDEGADHLLQRRAVVGGDPLGQIEEFGSNEWFRVDEIGEKAKSKIALGFLGDPQDSSGGGAIAEGDTDAATGNNGEAFRNSVVKDELGRPIDENTCGKRHG